MQRCKIQNAEMHNFREKHLDYVRPELSKDNFYVMIHPIAERLSEIRARYQESTGQRLQPNAAPIREIVVVGKMTPEMAEQFKNDIENRYGIEVLSYAFHADEGHYKVLTKEWEPNYHSHFIVDITIKEHRFVRRQKKSNGRIVRDDNGKPINITVDGYGKIRHFSKTDLRNLQDIAAKATGLDRGNNKTKTHLDIISFKVKQLEEDVIKLTQKKEVLDVTIYKSETSIKENALRESEFLKRRAHAVEGQIDYNIQLANDSQLTDYIIPLSVQKNRLRNCLSAEYEKTEDYNENLQKELESVIVIVQRMSTFMMKKVEAKVAKMKKDAMTDRLLKEAQLQLAAVKHDREKRKESCREMLEKYDTEKFDGMEDVGLADAIGRDIWNEVVEEIVEERNRGYGISY